MSVRVSPWSLTDDQPDSSAQAQTVFALANGYLGLRGSLEEDDVRDQGLVNGFYETWPITYPEDAYGLARVGQTIQPGFNPTRFALTVNGQPFAPGEAQLEDYRRRLDLKRGRLTRQLTWRTVDGIAVAIRSSRLVSMVEPGCALVDYTVTVSAEAEVELSHWLVFPQTSPVTGAMDPRQATSLANAVNLTQVSLGPPTLAAVARTASSGIGLACAVAHQIDGPAQTTDASDRQASGLRRVVRARLNPGQSLSLTALAAFACDGPRLSDSAQPATDQALLDAVHHTIARASTQGWSHLEQAQERAWADWWQEADIDVGAGADIQGGVRWSLFQVYQAAACAGARGIPAKGVTGNGYDGHIFWDAEAMVLPVLTYTQPDLARAALSYRYVTLERARQRATELHQRGALFAWRGIDGREASAFFEAGTAQYHIDADIAYAVNRYLVASADRGFLTSQAIDLLVETARLWADLGFFDPAGVFHLHGVTGPDEYSAMVDDNLYTNVMAATNLTAAGYWLGQLRDADPAAWVAARRRLNLDDDEIAAWATMAAAIAIPYDAALGVHGQDSAFLSHQLWDFAGTPAQSYPLLLHYHPLTIYRRQVLKQADVVLAMINRPDLFTPDQLRANFDYYDRLTTGDSTLSASAQAIMAARVGRLDLARRYFQASLAVDLADSHANAANGVHVAAAAAIWSILVQGFAGWRDWDGFSLDPHLPPGWTHLAFRLRLGDSVLAILIESTAVDLSLVSGGPIRLTVAGHTLDITDRRRLRLPPT